MTEHGHSHGHGHGLAGGWDRWSHVPMLRIVAGFIGVIRFLTVVALEVGCGV